MGFTVISNTQGKKNFLPQQALKGIFCLKKDYHTTNKGKYIYLEKKSDMEKRKKIKMMGKVCSKGHNGTTKNTFF